MGMIKLAKLYILPIWSNVYWTVTWNVMWAEQAWLTLPALILAGTIVAAAWLVFFTGQWHDMWPDLPQMKHLPLNWVS